MSTCFLHPLPPFHTTTTTLKPFNPIPNHRNFHPIYSLKTPSNTTTSNPLTTLTNILWPKTLPPQLLISTVRTIWNSTWQLMMSQLAPSDPTTGSYSRPSSQFRANPNQLSRQNSKTNLHLYVGLPCPWAHRTLIVRALKGLEEPVPVSVATPGVDGLWVFGGQGRDNANGCRTLKQVYKLREGGYDGRSTVPMLWDVGRKEVVCNESYDIIQLLNSGLNDLAKNPGLDLEPPSLKARIDEWNRVIYPNVNNGVYRCGFAQTQEAYDAAVSDLFNTLDMLDDHLEGSRYLCGDSLTLADICCFTTLIRFDLVYNVMFKCTKKKVVEYSNLHGYMRDIYQIPKVAETCNMEAMREGYYKYLFPLNPGNIQPVMPSGCEHEALLKPHNRESLSSTHTSMNTVLS
ncbi:hypothetical protein KSS87_018791 [Heliosperma pusillum]|nr:hypothetical protein KSS87_018791 [Heliosperma pusillum]